jgi:prevent-host-death family protein
MIHTTSITELRDRLAETIDSLEEENAILIVRHSKPAAYLVSCELFESLLERVEDLDDQADMAAALADYHQGKSKK